MWGFMARLQKSGKPGSKLRRVKYRLDDKENRFAIGAYTAGTVGRLLVIGISSSVNYAEGRFS